MINMQTITDKVNKGIRLTEEDALYLFNSNDILSIGKLANSVNKKKNHNLAFYNVNRHINPTNICAMTCKFCAYSRKPGDEGAYEYTIEEMKEKTRVAVSEGATEVHIVGGLHPRWPFKKYVDIICAIKTEWPDLHIKAFTAVEIDWLSRKARLSIKETLETLKEAGLNSMPGGGAEIFHQDVRDQICAKLTGEQWIDIHRTAHNMGFNTNSTMLYGHIETYSHRVDHMRYLRDLQDETKGFNAFIPLSFQPEHNEMGITKYTYGVDDLKTLAIARLYLDNFQHIKAYWIMTGQDVAQLGLTFGSNDLDGTVKEEKISNMAGGRSGIAMTRQDIERLVLRSHHDVVERDTLYNPIGEIHKAGSIKKSDSELIALVKEKSANNLALTPKEAHAFANEADLFALGQAAMHYTTSEKSYTPSNIIELKNFTNHSTLLDDLDTTVRKGYNAGIKNIYIDLAGVDDLETDYFKFSVVKEMSLELKNSFKDSHLTISGIKSLWKLMQQSELTLEDGFTQLKEMGISKLESSYNESENGLTASEILAIHEASHKAGIPSTAKIEFFIPTDDNPSWETYIARLYQYKELSKKTSKLEAIQIEPVRGQLQTISEYLEAVAIARIVMQEDCEVTTPFFKLPTIKPNYPSTRRKTYPVEKIAPMALVMGADSLGVLPWEAIDMDALNGQIKSAGFEVSL